MKKITKNLKIKNNTFRQRKNNSFLNVNGQVWTIDYFVGLFIFVAVLFTAIVLIRDLSIERDTYSETVRESDHIAATLLSEMSSAQNASNLSPVIIASNNRINKTLLQNFDNLTYSESKLYFQTGGEYIFYFYNGSIINESTCFRGYDISSADCSPNISSDASNVAKTERLVILDSKIVKLVVISWD